MEGVYTDLFDPLRIHCPFYRDLPLLYLELLDCGPGGGGGNAIYVPYGDVPLIRVYFLAFESETGCLFSSLTLK